MQLKRLSRLTLDDLYAHRLAAPLSLRDFELYLVYDDPRHTGLCTLLIDLIPQSPYEVCREPVL